jgi:phospholipid/cholesterol/gamma-HCH transport system ATP-binding protein
MIRLVDVHKAFGAKEVLRGVTLDVATGESVVIIGGSGSGKSVTLKCVLGLIPPDRGRIEVDGRPVGPGPDEAFLSRFGMLFQGAALFDSMPVWQNVAFRLLRGQGRLPRERARAVAIEKLARVGLGPEVADLFPAELSGGMQKRAGLARAIAADPSVIFFDEPTTGLDPVMSGVINRLIRGIVTEMGATAVTISHDLRTVRDVADRVAMLHMGRVHWQGAVAGIDTTEDPVVRQFVDGRTDGPIMAGA